MGSAPRDWQVLTVDGSAMHHTASLPTAWAGELWRAVDAGELDDHSDRPLPDGRRAHVKIYRRRAKHGWLRRLRAGRAAREGAGYREFGRLGIPTATLLAYGEKRRHRLHEWGLVCSLHAEVPDVAAAWRSRRDDELLQACAQLLASIHNAGLCHGDAVTRNFLAAHPRPLTFDLASWGRANRRRRTEDLTRFLGSVIKLSTEPTLARQLLRRYESFVVDGVPDADRLLERANRWASRAPRP